MVPLSFRDVIKMQQILHLVIAQIKVDELLSYWSILVGENPRFTESFGIGLSNQPLGRRLRTTSARPFTPFGHLGFLTESVMTFPFQEFK